MSDHLKGLNEAQKRAVLHTKGPLLIVAGAGAGKTRVITHRILNLIKQGVAPKDILAVTFTNKAASEMRERVGKLLTQDPDLNRPLSFADRPFIATFHALGVHLLRNHGSAIGIPQRFTIFDRSDTLAVMRRAIGQAGLDPKEYEPKTFLGVISKHKGRGLSAHTFRSKVGSDYFSRLVESVWPFYQKGLKEEKALDFDDLLLETHRLLKNESEVRKQYNALWKYIHVDEYQDTNKIQDDIVRLLAGEHKNICVVGDGDQNIYGWRGAELENILEFEKRYPGTTTILLEENYRSTQTILKAAHEIISKNKRRKEKTLFTKNVVGDRLELSPAYDQNEEAVAIVQRVLALTASNVPYKQIAVLYRANFQSRVLEEAFLSHDIPYQVLGVRFFDRKEVKDMLSFIQAARDSENIAHLKRIINVPPRGIGKVTFLKMVSGKEDTLPAKSKERVRQFRSFLQIVREKSETEPVSAVLKYILKESGLEKSLREGGEEGIERLENIKELVTLAARYDTLPQGESVEKLLDDAALASEQDSLNKESDTVKLMTVHASKGLEFDYVFITGLEEGLFPHQALSEQNDDPEEERRLFYVALTRARKKVFLSCASVRTIFGTREVTVPSSFITDIDEALIELTSPKRSGERIIMLDE